MIFENMIFLMSIQLDKYINHLIVFVRTVLLPQETYGLFGWDWLGCFCEKSRYEL
jgi:hypothetical protein